MQVPVEKLRLFIEAAHKAASCGLLQFSSGNMSFRVADDLAIITSKGSWLGELTENDIVICRISTEEILNDKQPSVETRFHLGILRSNPQINVVLHFQSPCATAVAASKRRDWNFNVIAEIPSYVGHVGFIDYMLPGSEELAQAVISQISRSGLVLLQNHGQVTCGTDFKDVIQKAGFFELACKILLLNHDTDAIEPHEIQKLIEKSKAQKGV